MKKLLLAILLLSLNVTYADQISSHESEKEKNIAKEKVDVANDYKPKDYEDCPKGEKIEAFGDGYICKSQDSSQNGFSTFIDDTIRYGAKVFEVLLKL